MKITVRIFALLVLATFVGCMSGGRNFDDSKISQIKKGETTEQDLVSWFGLPVSRSVNSSSELRMTWTVGQIHARPENYIPVAGLFMQGQSASSKTLMVVLTAGKVKDYTFSSSGGMPTTPVKTADKN